MKINKYEKFNILMALVFAVFMLVTAFLLTLLDNTAHQELKKFPYQGVACN